MILALSRREPGLTHLCMESLMTSSVSPEAVAARAQSFLTAISKRHEGVWKQVDEIRQLTKEHVNWNRSCYLPNYLLRSGFEDPAQIRGKYNRDPAYEQRKRIKDSPIIAGLAAWRLTKGIFLLDEGSIADAKEHGLPVDAEKDVFLNLPHQCIYVPTPGFTWLGDLLHGFFAYTDAHSDGELTLTLLMDRDDLATRSLTDVINVRLQYRIHAIKQPLTSRDDIVRNWSKAATGFSKEMRNLFLTPAMLEYSRRVFEQQERAADIDELLKALDAQLEYDIRPIAGVLYRICDVTSHIPAEDRPRYPKPIKTSSGTHMQPAQEVGIWDVDPRVRTLRQRSVNAEVTVNNKGSLPGPRKRPHPRSAHDRRLPNGDVARVSAAVVNAGTLAPDDRPITVTLIPKKQV